MLVITCWLCGGSARTDGLAHRGSMSRSPCPLVTLHDRAEPVVVHFDCDQFPAGRTVMGSRQNAHHRPCRGGPWKQRVYVQVTAVRRSSPLARPGPRRVLEQELERYLVPEALPRAPTRQCGRLCPPAAMTARTRRSCDLGMPSPSGSARCRARCRGAERYPVGPGTRNARSSYVGRTGFEPVTSSVSECRSGAWGSVLLSF
jgi:hypothetical protein